MSEIYQMAIHGLTPQGNYWATVWHWLYSATGGLVGITAAKDVATWFASIGGAAYQDVLPVDTQIKGIAVRRVSLGGGPTWVQPFEHLGTRSGVVQSAGVCPDIAWYPGEEPWNIGHTYLPGVTGTDLTEGQFTSGFSLAVDAFCAIMVADTNLTSGGSTLDFVLWNSTDDTFAVVITGQLKAKPTLMNRRLKPVTT